MNTFVNCSVKKFALRRLLPVAALIALPPLAFAQTRVTVENSTSMPVPVAGTVNVNPAPQVLFPYQQQGSVSDSSACAPQCIISFPIVQAGRRLVITNVSAQLSTDISSFVIEGNGVTFFVPKPYPTAGNVAQPVTIYFEPGSTPSARFFVQDATVHASLIVTFTGYFVPISS
jgi:hypothetical protein